MIELNINEANVEKMLLHEIQNKLQHLENRYTFWDMDELSKQTCMSKGNIKDKFFYDEGFPKYKVGGKWYVPAKEAEDFLLGWLKKQPTH